MMDTIMDLVGIGGFISIMKTIIGDTTAIGIGTVATAIIIIMAAVGTTAVVDITIKRKFS